MIMIANEQMIKKQSNHPKVIWNDTKYDLRIYVFVGVEWLLSTLGGVLIGGDAVLRIGGGGCSVGTTWEQT